MILVQSKEKKMEYIPQLKKVDAIMAGLIEKYGEINYKARYTDGPDAYFENLVTSIIGQQLSLKAAETIESRVVKCLGGKITPVGIIEADSDELRKQGLSTSKTEYIKNLSVAVYNNKLNLSMIDTLSDEEVIIELTKIKGIGKWTAEMFLIFSLKRPDVFSFADVGLINAIKRLYGETIGKEEVQRITNQWKPYRSFASMYLWRSLE